MEEPAVNQSPTEGKMRKPERMRTRLVKRLMIEILGKLPLVEAACNKAGISRSTHYEWLHKDDKYREKVYQATKMGVDLVNDIAENNIIGGVKRGEHKSSTFWLKNRHPAYKKKSVITRAEEPEPEIDLLEEGLMRLPGYIPSNGYVSSHERSDKKRRRHPHDNVKFDKATLERLKKYEAPDDDDLDEERDRTPLEP